LLTCLGLSVVISLAACAERMEDSSVSGSPELPLQTPLQAGQAPVVPLESSLHVGADVGPPAGALAQAALHGDVRISHGSVQDGVGAAELIAYLEADSSLPPTGEEEGMPADTILEVPLLRFRSEPPTVYVVDGTPPALVDETVRVVQAINAALPRTWQLQFSPDPAPAGALPPADGRIHVTFAPQEDWPTNAMPPYGEDIGLAEPVISAVLGPIGIYPLRSTDDLDRVRLIRELTPNVALASLSSHYASTILQDPFVYGEGASDEAVKPSPVSSERFALRTGLTVTWPTPEQDIAFAEE
jgi:hypothetical protein